MAVCSDCGFQNDEERLFCGSCGEPLKGDAKLMADAKKLKEKKEAEALAKAEAAKVQPLQGRPPKDDEHYEFKRRPPKKKDNLDVILIGFAMIAFVVLVVCGWYIFKYLPLGT